MELFAWEAAWQRILTLDKWIRRDKILVIGVVFTRKVPRYITICSFGACMYTAFGFGLQIVGAELGYCQDNEGGALGVERLSK